MPQSENSEIRTTDLVYLCLLLGLCMIATLLVVLRASGSASEMDRAQRRAESLALQLQQIRAQNLSQLRTELAKQEGRHPASVELDHMDHSDLMRPFGRTGEIGEDPWGKPYQYQVLTQAGGSYLLVWSSGADKKPNTDPSKLILEEGESKDMAFSGDDIGVLVALE